MRRIKSVGAGVLAGVLLWLQVAQAQFGIGEIVFDPTNLVENAAAALRLLTVIENQFIDLEPRGEGPGGELVAFIEGLMALIASMRGLIPFNPDAVEGIFDVLYPTGEAVPCTSEAIRVWRFEAERQTRLALMDSMRAQSLIGQYETRVGQLLRLVEGIVGLLGSVRGLQSASELQSVLVGEGMSLNTINATFQRSIASREAMAVTERAAFECQYVKSMEDWPRR
jgi:conjugal transfer/entry exclusion protein